MGKQYIDKLRLGDQVSSCFAVASKQLAPYSTKSSKAGEEYLKVTLKDVTGTIDGRIWDNALEFSALFDVDDIVFVEGTVTKFNGLQLMIHNLEYVAPESVDISDFVPSSKKSISEMAASLQELIDNIETRMIRLVLQDLFNSSFLTAFGAAPGGRSIHHAYRGGLLEHTLEVAAIARHLCALYPGLLNSDILTAGAILHDVGKTLEYDLNSISFQLTDRGKLHGHLILGRDMLLRCTNNIEEFPQELEDELGHMILSHHGCREWGSPELPKTAEAFALFHADLISARLTQAIGIINTARPSEKWTSWDRLLERSFFTPERQYTGLEESASASEPEQG